MLRSVRCPSMKSSLRGSSRRVSVLGSSLVLAFGVSFACAVISGIAIPIAEAGGEGEGDREDAPTDWARAVEPRGFEFPRDHGSHPDFRTEWWYLTGELEAGEGRERFGFQATWFRSGLAEPGVRPDVERRVSGLAAGDLFFFHGAVTDVARGRFLHESIASRGARAWASARSDDLDVWLFDRKLRREGDVFRVEFPVQGRRVELELRPVRDPLFHGESPGLSQKGPEAGQASYYYSLTRMEARGTLQREPGGPTLPVRGRVWLDREFGSHQLGDDQIGWDWFSVALSDGSDLMLYEIRREDGSVEPTSSGTLRSPQGERLHLGRGDYTVEVLDRWESRASGGTYPSRWRLRVPSRSLELEVRPVLAEQELRTGGTTGVDYWEGLCDFEGTVEGQPVRGSGYVELVGYVGRFPGL